jgi:cytoskeletal protein RodZ
LNAVENEDKKNLPAPVFVRGYITQIAKVLGIDGKKAADSYMVNFNKAGN